ncbi:MAG: tyrosine-type recombinase/integrase [Hyphomicrobiales bacterium]
MRCPEDRTDLCIVKLVERYFDWKQEIEQQRESTLYNQRKTWDAHILPRFGNVKVTKLRSMDVQRFVNEYVKNRPGTANTIHASMSAFLGWCVKQPDVFEGGFTINFMRDFDRPVKVKSRNRYLNDNEIQRLFKALPHLNGFGPVVEVLLRTGLRRAEVAELRWEQVDFEHTQFIHAGKDKDWRPYVGASAAKSTCLNRNAAA